MRPFEHIDVGSFEEAAKLLAGSKENETDVMAGGTDLINVYKHAILKEHPEKVISLKKIPDAAGIETENGTLTIKAMTKLSAVAGSEEIHEKAAALSDAAISVATPLIRNVGTIGGNICQDVRCWYYRYPHEVGGRMECSRKGGDTCFAIRGENRYHSIFGGMKTHSGPCAKSCPANTDISGYMALLRAGDWDGAARKIMEVNPLPMVTSRICPHPCQDSCNQCGYGDSVSIHCVERTVGDYILKNADRFYEKPEKETGKKTGIIGAGPGGLAAAYFLRKAGHAVTVIDSHEKAGGVLMYGIPHYRLPKDIVEAYVKALADMGVVFELNKTVGKDISMDEITGRFDGIYFGTGAWKQPILGIQGEDLTEFGLDFLVEVNTFLKKSIDDDVLVCGGGNVAMDVALTAKRMGAKNVRLVCLESEKEMPATEEEVSRAREEGIEISNGWGLKEVLTDDSGKVCGLRSMRCTSVFDEEHRFSPRYDEDETQTFGARTIILATGQRVDTSFLGEKFGAQLKTARGLFDVDQETFQTRNDKIFAGGDAVTGPNIAIRAINAGGIAAKSMSKKLGYPIIKHEDKPGFLSYDVRGVRNPAGAKLSERAMGERSLTDEDAQSLSIADAQKEAARCMNCGCYSVNASDIAPALMALGGTIVTTKKQIPANDFFTVKLKAYAMLDQDELVTAVKVPDMSEYKTGYIKTRIRTSVDFALVSLAYAYKLENGMMRDVRLVFSGVAPVPVRLTQVEQLLEGKKPTDALAKQAGELSVKDARPMEKNTYKVFQARALIERLISGIR